MSCNPPLLRDVVVVEYHDGIPGIVVALDRWEHHGEPWFKPGRDRVMGWAFRWIHLEWVHGQLYWHESGSGGGYPSTHSLARFVKPKPPKAKLWVDETVRLVAWQSKRRPEVPLTRRQALSRGYEVVDDLLDFSGAVGVPGPLFNPFDDEISQQTDRFTWCERCRLMLPEDTNGGGPCEHIDYCDTCERDVYLDTHQSVDSPDSPPLVHPKCKRCGADEDDCECEEFCPAAM